MLTWDKILSFSEKGNLKPDFRVEKTESEWRQNLSEEQFFIVRKSGTEKPFSSDVCQQFEAGDYHCVCCYNELFNNDLKFDSGSGWPSFSQPTKDNAIAYFADDSNGMKRIEVKCSACDAHLGHVFPDGPAPSKLRFCINALAMVKKA